MSRFEELMQKLLNGETIAEEDFPVMSRLEKALIACINKTGTDGLDIPQSRAEELLQLLSVQMTQTGSGGGSEYLVECENLPETIDKSKVYRVSEEITLGEFNDIYICVPALKDIYEKEFVSFKESLCLSGTLPFIFNYVLVDSLPDYDSFVNGEVTVYDKISNKTIDVTMLDEQQMYMFISEETSDAYILERAFLSMSEALGAEVAGIPLPCMGAVTSVSEITETGLYLMYYAGDRHIAYILTDGADEPYLLDNAILYDLVGPTAPFFTEPVMDHILFDSTQSTDEGIYDLVTGNFRENGSTYADHVPTVIAIDINDYSAYMNVGSGLRELSHYFNFESKGVVDSLDEMTEEGYYILKRNNNTSGEGTGNINTSIHVPYSGEYSDVTVEYPEGTINSTYRDPIQATITPSEEVQELNSTSTSYIDKVTVEAIRTEEKTVTPTESAQTITPATGKYIDKVTVEAIRTEEKTVTPTESAQTITPTAGKYIDKVTVKAIQTEKATVSSSETTQTITVPEGTFCNKIVIEYGTKSDRTDFTGLFRDKHLSEIRLIDTSNATTMSYMFGYCRGTFQTIPLLDTRNVTDMGFMFLRCTSLRSIPPLDTSNVTNMGAMFDCCWNLTSIPLLNTSKVTNMSKMFCECTSLTTIPLLDTSNVTHMSRMFLGCTKLTTIPLLNTRNVTDMKYMFDGCTNLTSIPLLDTSNVTNMVYMFDGCTNLTSIPLLDTSNVTNMQRMFANCTNLTTIPALDTSNVTNMDSMFVYCRKLTSIPLLDTSNVTNMDSMFDGCINLTSISLLDTSKVTNMSGMFSDCQKLTSIPLLDTSNVTAMNSTFFRCISLTTIPLLDTSNVIRMSGMFANCTNLTTVPALDTSKVSNMSSMFDGCTSLKSILMTGMKTSFDISSSTQFEQADLVTILNNLATVSSAYTLKMGTTNLAKLTDEDKAIATNKGWTLA